MKVTKIKSVEHHIKKAREHLFALELAAHAEREATIESAEKDSQFARRTLDWLHFAETVAEHIEHYTVPQYGDAPDDQVEGWTAEHCVNQLHKYASRFGSNKREGQDALDLLKIAHYAQLAYDKLKKETQHGA